MSRVAFHSGRTGAGAAYRSDASGSSHARFMRLSAMIQAPLALIGGWFIIGLAGKTYAEARAELAHPLPALTLIALILCVSRHARYGMDTIIDDYVHDRDLHRLAMTANLWATRGFAAMWVIALVLIAAPKP